MLNRRFLRIKVLQALYAYLESGDTEVAGGIRNLLESISKLHELFVWQLSFIVETKRFADNKITDNRNKFIPTYEDSHPNMRYVQNRVINAIEDNRDFQRKEAAYNINWGGMGSEVVKNYYNIMRDSEEYKAYMTEKTDNWDHDKKFLVKMIETYYADLEVLQDFYEEKSIFFCDDYHLVSSMLIKFIGDLRKFDVNDKLPTIYKTENDEVNVDEEFVKRLFRETLRNGDEFGNLIVDNTNNWEKDRICVMDMIIMKMAITELRCFPEIPVKVTMNEYIEISKFFSTPKSKNFINGLLDRLLKKMESENMIEKKGLGLLEK
ncbi:MAG: transcription antitermination protein NusB [Bacteroidales bacterium]|nr:transcription antitermination protein NusB [Bacteroidales bacterium]